MRNGSTHAGLPHVDDTLDALLGITAHVMAVERIGVGMILGEHRGQDIVNRQTDPRNS